MNNAGIHGADFDRDAFVALRAAGVSFPSLNHLRFFDSFSHLEKKGQFPLCEHWFQLILVEGQEHT